MYADLKEKERNSERIVQIENAENTETERNGQFPSTKIKTKKYFFFVIIAPFCIRCRDFIPLIKRITLFLAISVIALGTNLNNKNSRRLNIPRKRNQAWQHWQQNSWTFFFRINEVAYRRGVTLLWARALTSKWYEKARFLGNELELNLRWETLQGIVPKVVKWSCIS